MSEPYTRHEGGARSYAVPAKRIVSIEHPCITPDVDNAFKSLGGEQQLKRVLELKIKNSSESRGRESSAVVSFRPDDCFAQKMASTVVPTRNVLVRVTLPKRTGRKRKRGSDAPFESGPASSVATQSGRMTSADLLQGIRDNSQTYSIEPVGMIEDTHRFEDLPDYQTRADEVPVMREIRDHLSNPTYDSLKKFHINLDAGLEDITSFPGPPTFVPEADSFEWQYQQAVAKSKPKTSRPKRPSKQTHRLRHIGFPLTSEEVPQGPELGADGPGQKLQRTLAAVKKLFQDRPIFTIRALAGVLKNHTVKRISQCIPHVGYFVSKGPWRDTIVRYGVDPRKDPRYRTYQTLRLFLYRTPAINEALKTRALTADAHVFNGTTLSDVGIPWQICDLTDPVLQRLASTQELRSKCDNDKKGWFYNGTIAKLRVIMVDKMKRIVNGEEIPGNDFYDVLAALPDQITTAADCLLQRSVADEIRQLARDINREAIKCPPRYYYILQKNVIHGGDSDSAESGGGDESEDNDTERDDDDAGSEAEEEDLHAPSVAQDGDDR